MDDFMDTLLKKEFAQADIPDAGFSERVKHAAFQHNRERMALIVGGLLAGTLVALLSVPDIISILSVQISSLSQAGVQSISLADAQAGVQSFSIPDTQSWIAGIKLAITNQSSILAAISLALLAPVFLLVFEE